MALTKRQVYLYGAGAAAVGRGLELFAAFATMWLLTHMLAVEDYGYYVVALTLIELIALVAAGGLESVVVFRSARIDAPPGELAGGGVTGVALARGVVAGVVVAGVVALAAPWIADGFDKPPTEAWIRGLSLLLPILVARSIYAAWHRGRQRLAQAVLLGQSAPKLASVLLLAVVWLAAPEPRWIVAALVCGPLLALSGWIASAPPGPLRLRGELSAWDQRYGLKLMLTALVSRGSRAVEILLLGLLATGAVTALFSVSASLASLALVPHNVLGRVFGPRLGSAHARRQRDELRREYDQTRALAFVASLAMATFLAAFGEPVLGLFGDYRDGYPIMLIVVAGYLTQASFGTNGLYLVMAGYGGWSLAMNVGLLTASAGLSLLLIPRFGGLGAAAAVFGSLLLIRIVISVVVWRLERFATVSAEVAAVTASVVALLWLAALGALPGPHAAAGLLLLLGLVLFRERALWIPELRRVAVRLR